MGVNKFPPHINGFRPAGKRRKREYSHSLPASRNPHAGRTAGRHPGEGTPGKESFGFPFLFLTPALQELVFPSCPDQGENRCPFSQRRQRQAFVTRFPAKQTNRLTMFKTRGSGRQMPM